MSESKDVEEMASEATPLMLSSNSEKEESKVTENNEGNGGGDGLSSSNNSAGGNSSDYSYSAFVDDELERPWPATFERSISLLAGPTMDTTFIEQVTKSPKITPNLAARRRNENYLTPEPQRIGGLIGQNHQFKQEINKVQSLDFGKFDSNRRVIDAKLYRQKLLEEAQKRYGIPVKDEEQEKSEKKNKKKKDVHGGHGVSSDKASYGQCIFNLANILMGVGMLGLPFVFKSAGWIGGIFVTLTFSSTAWRTSILLGRELNGDPKPSWMFDDDSHTKSAAEPRMRKQISSFPDIAREAFGQTGNIFLSFVLYFELFSCLCIFFVTLGDHLHTLFPQISVQKHMTYVSFLLTIPTALLRTPRLLSYLSAVGTFATGFVVWSVFGMAIYDGDVSEEVAERKNIEVSSTHTLWRPTGLPIAFGLIAYTFSGHAIIPSIYSSMSCPQQFESMVTTTFLGVTFCCLVVAASGYYMFGSVVDDQITLSLEQYSGDKNIMMQSLTWLMILTAFSKFTLSAFPLALGLEEIVAPIVPSDYVMEWVSSFIKILLIGGSLAVAIFVPYFSVLCSLVGLICTMIVSVIFPAAAHLKLFGSRLPLWEVVIDWIFIISGSVMAVFGTIQSIRS